MIIFKKITYRNFLSSGNQKTEIDLAKYKTNLHIGSNGSGKSILLDSLTFVLFNKPFRKISKSQLVNSTNLKDCLVELDFSIGSKKYKIVRGIKPNIFEIWIDKVLQKQLASSTDQQKYLEESILKINYKSFTQIVILGSASFIPFMQLSSSNRREIVEDLLDIKVFSAMNSIVKEKIKNTNDTVKELFLTEKLIKEKIEMQKHFIQNIEESGKESVQNRQDKIEKIKKFIQQIKNKNAKIQKQIDDILNPSLNELLNSSKSLKQLSSLRGKLSQKITSILEQNAFFKDNTVCPTCTQNLDEKFRLNKIGEIQEKSKELQNALDELENNICNEEEKETKINQIKKEINRLNNEISNNDVKISQLNQQKKELEKEIQVIASKIKNRNAERDKLTELETEFNLLEQEKIKYKENLSYFEFIHFLMKDNGIKAKIIQKYLPLMNKLINKYLQLMDFYINFTFDDEFNETIRSPIYEDFSYESFSEGEKMRINLAILFTWIEIARMKNSISCNILLFDEVFDSSLDDSGTDYFTKIIKYVIKDTNIFVISHKNGLEDKFDNVLEFKKVKGFSKMVDN